MEEVPKMSDEETDVESRVENPVSMDKNVLKDSEEQIEDAFKKAESLELETPEQEEARLAGIEDDDSNPLQKAA